MPRLRASALALAVLAATPLGLAAQSATTGQPAPAPANQKPTLTIDADPWLVIFRGEQPRSAGSSSRTTIRANVVQLDKALESYDVNYRDLSADERARLRGAFDEIAPGQYFNRYRINVAQARAMAYLALGPWERIEVPCAQPAPTPEPEGPSRCEVALDETSRHAATIHSTILALGRSGNRKPRDQEMAALKDIASRAREIVVQTPRCGCRTPAADADSLLVGTRQAVDAYEASGMPAWMALNGDLVQRIARLSDQVERAVIRCLADARE
ncbi:MAG TPA: hypothetical protein VNA89_07865 [Gemmatimonadaceae bacterium]|nr:hypothetical protein [Gemmatimonadaceae bacterium]